MNFKDFYVGQEVVLGDATIVTIISRDARYNKYLVEDSEKNKDYIKYSELVKGNTKWKFDSVYIEKYKPRMGRYKSKYGEYFKVVAIKGNESTICWEDSGNVAVVNNSLVANESCYDVDKIPPERAEGYYVYLAKSSDEIVYIGKGKGDRYKHVNSGISKSYCLNKAHFSGTVFDIVIVKDGMFEEDAFALENKLIKKYRPAYNIAGISLKTPEKG